MSCVRLCIAVKADLTIESRNIAKNNRLIHRWNVVCLVSFVLSHSEIAVEIARNGSFEVKRVMGCHVEIEKNKSSECDQAMHIKVVM